MSLDIFERSPDLWQVNDKIWLKSRKAEWRIIQSRLAGVTHDIPRKLWKPLKQYFIYGDIPYPDYSYAGSKVVSNIYGNLPQAVLQFWFHPVEPDPSMTLLPDTFAIRMNDARRNFFQQWYGKLSRAALAENRGEYGVMGGREKVIVAFLNPRLDFREDHRFGEDVVDRSCLDPFDVFHSCINGTVSEITSYSKYSPYHLGIYLWEHLDYALEHYPLGIYGRALIDSPEQLKEDEYRDNQIRRDNILEETLQSLIVFFDRKPDDEALQRAGTAAFVGGLVGKYERGEFTEAMQSRWDEAKSKIKPTK